MPSQRPPWRSVLQLLGAAVTFRLVRYEVSEESMSPILEPRDWAVGARRPRRVVPGDVVVFDHPQRPGFELVKRVDRVDGDGLFVVGEGSESVDSTTFGEIPRVAITARLLAVYHPTRRWL